MPTQRPNGDCSIRELMDWYAQDEAREEADVDFWVTRYRALGLNDIQAREHLRDACDRLGIEDTLDRIIRERREARGGSRDDPPHFEGGSGNIPADELLRMLVNDPDGTNPTNIQFAQQLAEIWNTTVLEVWRRVKKKLIDRASEGVFERFPDEVKAALHEMLQNGEDDDAVLTALSQTHRIKKPALLRALKKVRNSVQHARSRRGRPELMVSGPRVEVLDRITKTLPLLKIFFRQGDSAQWRVVATTLVNAEMQHAFERAGIRIGVGTPVVYQPKEIDIADRTDRACYVYEVTDEGPKQVDFPPRLVREWMQTTYVESLLPLRAIRATPLIRGDGTLALEPGYDEATGYYIAPHNLKISVPQCPTREQAEAAAEKFMSTETGIFRTYPFRHLPNGAGGTDEGKTSRAGALALTLTLAGRSLFETKVPGFIADAPQPRTGKMHMLTTAALVALGQKPVAVSLGTTKEERDKRLTHALVNLGHEFPVFDNINGENGAFANDDLATLQGEGRALIRPYGQAGERGETKPVHMDFTIGFTGNKIALTNDLETRNLKIGLDAMVADPAGRHFAFEPHKEALEKRSEHLSAAFTLLRWSIQNPMPPSEAVLLAATGSFDTWRKIVRDGIWQLYHIDVGRLFGETRSADPKQEERHEVLMALRDVFDSGDFTAQDVAEILRPRSEAESQEDSASEVDSATRDRRRHRLMALSGRQNTAQSVGIRLGKHVEGWCSNGKYRLWKRTSHGSVTFAVRSVEEDREVQVQARKRSRRAAPGTGGTEGNLPLN